MRLFGCQPRERGCLFKVCGSERYGCGTYVGYLEEIGVEIVHVDETVDV
jgi:hypothetical protein